MNVWFHNLLSNDEVITKRDTHTNITQYYIEHVNIWEKHVPVFTYGWTSCQTMTKHICNILSYAQPYIEYGR